MNQMNLSNLTEQQLDGIRQRVLASIKSVEAGEYKEYEGREGLKKLADEVKARGRKRLAQHMPLTDNGLLSTQRHQSRY